MFAVTLVTWLGVVTVAMAASVPSTALVIGEGYNLLKGNPDGAQWQSGGVDPGIMFAHKIFKLDTAQELSSEVSIHDHGTCQTHQETDIVYSPKSYQDKLLQRVTFDGPQISNLNAAAFSLSSGYHDVKVETGGHHHVIYDALTTCVRETAHYKMSLVTGGRFQLTNEIVADICKLPATHDVQAYSAFIDKWGTHVITEANLGHRETARSRMNDSDFVTYVMKQAPTDVSSGGSSYRVDVNSFKSSLSFSDSIGQPYGTLKTGSDASPEPVSLGLTSIDVVLSPAFWQGSAELYTFCPDDITRTVAGKQQTLQSVLHYYPGMKRGEVPSSGDLLVPKTRLTIIG